MTALLHDERGSVTVEAALWLAPAMLALVGLVQIALWWAAVDTCSAAAQEGLDTGRVLGGTPAAAHQAATTYLARAAALARDPQVSTAGTTEARMRVSVSAEVVMVVPIPGWQWHVTYAVAGVREHPTTPQDS
ncbi:TadE/TadG family type IV pilus assembly protein [Kutzneria sp. NPDC052558]|uniref:TadE/TadG family type IV pilus assembly protein n=1 Tax=Kutzneria sp. NPDC052558 TaxID=3364121 RepID=UPI0037CA7245